MQPSYAPIPVDLIERFWARVDQTEGLLGCWPWMGNRDRDGYGLVQLDKKRMKTRRAPRVALELKLGRPLTADEQARHSCDNPPCVNPAHLAPGDAIANTADRLAHGTVLRGARNPMNTRPDRRPRGSANGHATLTEEKVAQIKRLLLDGVVVKEIAATYRVTAGAIYFIANGTNWRHITPADAA